MPAGGDSVGDREAGMWSITSLAMLSNIQLDHFSQVPCVFAVQGCQNKLNEDFQRLVSTFVRNVKSPVS